MEVFPDKNDKSHFKSNSSDNKDCTSLADRLRQWAQEHRWDKIHVVTHQLAFKRKFSMDVKALAIKKETCGQKVTAGQISEAYETVSRLCRKIDRLTRKGCETEEELDELDSCKTYAQAGLFDLARLIELSSDQPPKEKPAPRARKQRTRASSSLLSTREQSIWAMVHVQGKTVSQAAIELDCTPQNISKHLKNAERKMKAQQSRSVQTDSQLPQDSRGQVSI